MNLTERITNLSVAELTDLHQNLEALENNALERLKSTGTAQDVLEFERKRATWQASRNKFLQLRTFNITE